LYLVQRGHVLQRYNCWRSHVGTAVAGHLRSAIKPTTSLAGSSYKDGTSEFLIDIASAESVDLLKMTSNVRSCRCSANLQPRGFRN
jgi:hypothetical protein